MKRFAILPFFVLAALAAHAENFGNSTTNVGADVVVTFTESGTFRLAEPGTVRVLLVGGGGAGGSNGTNSAGVDVSGGGKGGDGVVIVRWSDPAGLLLLVK